jgi:hypothetical protein
LRRDGKRHRRPPIAIDQAPIGCGETPKDLGKRLIDCRETPMTYGKRLMGFGKARWVTGRRR